MMPSASSNSCGENTSGSSSGCSSGFSAELYQFQQHQPDHRHQQQPNRTNNITTSGKQSSAFLPTHHIHQQSADNSNDQQFAATSFYQQSNSRLIAATAPAGATTEATEMLVSSGQLNNGPNNSSLLHRAQQQQKAFLSHHHHNHYNSTTTRANLTASANTEIVNGKSRLNNNDSVGQSATTGNFEPERPIGYGAFGVVWSVTDPRDHRRVALKKMPNVFQNLASCKRVFRELYMLSSFKHDNVLSLLDILQPNNPHFFSEIYILTELMQSDLHRIIVSPQPLSADHVKVFVYQILRGIKYLHSANVLHRDIKPGNLLVNSNCILKICDFGLARIWDRNEHTNMTHEVVTQYYRAPELLMGCRRYTAAVDVWSVGCIFAELLSRRILFQAHGPVEQLNMIINLLGTPKQEELRVLELNTCCSAALKHVINTPHRSASLQRFYEIIQIANHDSIPLVVEMLKFDPTKRISIDDALKHPYLDDGRMRFHSCMCTCCQFLNGTKRDRIYCKVLEPVHCKPFDPVWEKDMARKSMFECREILYDYITKRTPLHGTPLCINTGAACYGDFVNSTVAQPSELPPSPNAWD